MYSYLDILNLRKKIRWSIRFLSFVFLLVFGIWYANCLPEKLFTDSFSTVVLDRNGKLLSAHISADEQWRFQECDSVPFKFKKAIIEFEDRHFYTHIGISMSGISRAILQNIKNNKRVSGGSTITMQVVRLMRKNPKRTYSEKIYEMILATRIELSYSKDEILRLYASHAPFGNNVVGIDAASWRFFGRSSHELSWAESATLAVLPNAPGLIYPGRNHTTLLAKRNRLLKRLFENGEFDKITYEMSLLEPLPNKPVELENHAPHFLTQSSKSGKKGTTIHSDLEYSVQIKSTEILERHMSLLRENQIFNAAILIKNVKTGKTICYIGNSSLSGVEHNSYVNCIPAPRSSGSILKPILYAKALESGDITPEMLLVDVPSKFGGFSPKNFSGNFEGLIAADEALARSLNIPMVHLLNQYGLSHFKNDLTMLGFKTVNKSAAHYGLSLILGGAEVSLENLSNCYTNMARALCSDEKSVNFPLDKACIYATFDAMLQVRRPDEDLEWQSFESSKKIAWKTGTSFGFRDAWAIGITPDYVVSVWVGNADGEGRPGLVGAKTAAPILFDLFRLLPAKTTWFEKPSEGFRTVEICQISGHRAGMHCDKTKQSSIPTTCLQSIGCPYHKLIHLDKNEQFRVNANCAAPTEIHSKSWFIISPTLEKWFSITNPTYQKLPPIAEKCKDATDYDQISILYPKHQQKIFLPKDFSGSRRSLTLEATSTDSETTLFWHLDDQFIGQTNLIHQFEVQPTKGLHVLTITNEDGQTQTIRFEITD